MFSDRRTTKGISAKDEEESLRRRLELRLAERRTSDISQPVAGKIPGGDDGSGSSRTKYKKKKNKKSKTKETVNKKTDKRHKSKKSKKSKQRERRKSADSSSETKRLKTSRTKDTVDTDNTQPTSSSHHKSESQEFSTKTRPPSPIIPIEQPPLPPIPPPAPPPPPPPPPPEIVWKVRGRPRSPITRIARGPSLLQLESAYHYHHRKFVAGDVLNKKEEGGGVGQEAISKGSLNNSEEVKSQYNTPRPEPGPSSFSNSNQSVPVAPVSPSAIQLAFASAHVPNFDASSTDQFVPSTPTPEASPSPLPVDSQDNFYLRYCVEGWAHYFASLQARNFEEHLQFVGMYREHYLNQISTGAIQASSLIGSAYPNLQTPTGGKNLPDSSRIQTQSRSRVADPPPPGSDEATESIRVHHRSSLEHVPRKLPESEYGKRLSGDSIGGKMLQKMGWAEGQGLGRSRQGRTEPVIVERKDGRAGLGSENRSSSQEDNYDDELHSSNV